ncbi:hypothetical protein A6R68_24125, partial [Neotoma lepida]
SLADLLCEPDGTPSSESSDAPWLSETAPILAVGTGKQCGPTLRRLEVHHPGAAGRPCGPDKAFSDLHPPPVCSLMQRVHPHNPE